MEAKPTIKIRTEAVRRARILHGLELNDDLAAKMRFHPSNVGRTLNGRHQKVSADFIACLCTALESSFNDLFVIVGPDENEERAA